MAPDLPTPTVTSTGTVLAERYHLGRLIARGGMADVFEAHDELLDRRVAVKVFRAAEAAQRERFDAEVRLLAGLNHPGLVAVYDAGEHAGDGYMVLELVEGPTLRDVLADRAPLPDGEVAALGSTLADALAHVHERGIVHRDLTPANVLCGTAGSPRLTDFGIARLLDTTRVTAEHLAIGTVGYMAPEQVEGKDVTPAADVYALGLVLLEALTAKPAFTGPSHEVAIARLTRDPAVPTELPSPWPDLLRAMTARRPEDRPTAAAVAARLREARRSSSGAAGLPTGDGAPRARKGPALVVPSSQPAADPHAETASLPIAETGPAPDGTRTGAAPVTSVMPAAMLPVDEPASGRASQGSTPATGTTDEHTTTQEAPLVAALAAGAAGVQEAVGAAARTVRRRARRMTFHQWLAVAAAAVFVLAMWQSRQGDWSDQVLAARAAAEAEAPAPTTTTVAPTTTTTAAPVVPPPVVEDDDDRGGGKGKGKGKDDDDDD